MNLLRELAFHLSMGTCFKPELAVPTPLQSATTQLVEAQFKLLEHSAAAEYHDAMVEMLQERLKRLSDDIDTLKGIAAEEQIASNELRMNAQMEYITRNPVM